MIASANRARKPAGHLLLVTSLLSVLAPSINPIAKDALKRTQLSGPDGQTLSEATSAAEERRAVESYAKLPVSFEVNSGQTDPRVKFLSRCNAYNLFLTPTAAVLTLQTPTYRTGNSRSAALRLELLNSNPAPRIEGLDPLPGKTNYLTGNAQRKWRTNVSTYEGSSIMKSTPA